MPFYSSTVDRRGHWAAGGGRHKCERDLWGVCTLHVAAGSRRASWASMKSSASPAVFCMEGPLLPFLSLLTLEVTLINLTSFSCVLAIRAADNTAPPSRHPPTSWRRSASRTRTRRPGPAATRVLTVEVKSCLLKNKNAVCSPSPIPKLSLHSLRAGVGVFAQLHGQKLGSC